MISAFGISHVVSKNAEGDVAGAAAAAAKKAARAARPRLTPEQIEELKAARTERIARGEATEPPKPKEKQDPNAQRRTAPKAGFLSGRQTAHLAFGIPLGVGGLAAGHHLSKADKKDAAAVAAGAAGGAVAIDQADTLAGAGLKRAAHKQRETAGAPTEAHKQSLRAHQEAHGFVDEHGVGRHPTMKDSHAAKNRYFRNYPKDLPAARVQRLNAVRDTVEGPKLMAAGALLGGGYVAHRIHDRNVAKADTGQRDHKEAKEAAGAAVGGAAGQGAYQQAGYSTKHYVDRHTRKGNPGVTPEQVKLQDKVLKPLKREHGMHLPNGTPGRNNVGYHRSYPTELPHGRAIRALGHTHEGRLGVAVGAATTAVAAAGGAAAVHHHVKKNQKEAAVSTSAFGVEHEISKGIVGEALKMGQEAVGGLKSGFGIANKTPVSAAGKLGAQTGQAAVTGAKKLKPLVATPKRALAVGTGTGVLGGAALTHNNGNS